MNSYGRNSLDSKAAEGNASFYLSKERQFEPQASDTPIFYRMVVLEVIHDPASIDDVMIDRLEHEMGVTNVKVARALPRNTIVARRILDGTASASEPVMFLFPFLPPHIAMPCKPGEHVWAMFESPQKRQDVGWWLWRISEPHFVDDMNHTHGPRAFDPSFNPGIGDKFEGKDNAKYEFRNGRPETTGDGGRYTVAESAMIPGGEAEYEKILKSPAVSLVAYGPVPRFRKRPGDIVLEGSNNTLIVLGTDRIGSAGTPTDTTGSQAVPPTDVPGAGAIDMVAGRGQTDRTGGKVATNTLGRKELAKAKKDVTPAEGDPDMLADRARVYIAQATKVDTNLRLADLNKSFSGVKDSKAGDGTVAVIADKVRIVSRSDVEIVATGFTADPAGLPKRLDDAKKYAVVILKPNGDIVLRPGSGGVVKLGTDDADQHVVLGDDLVTYLKNCVNTFNNHLHTGESTPPGGGPVASMPPMLKMSTPTTDLLSKLAHVKKDRSN